MAARLHRVEWGEAVPVNKDGLYMYMRIDIDRYIYIYNRIERGEAVPGGEEGTGNERERYIYI